MKIYSGTFESSLNGPGFSITLCNISLAAAACRSSTSELLDLLSDQTTAPAWPNVLSNTSTKVTRTLVPHTNGVTKPPQLSPSEDILSKCCSDFLLGYGKHVLIKKCAFKLNPPCLTVSFEKLARGPLLPSQTSPNGIW